MQLRTINDQCAALQSKINKKLENLQMYCGYKDFLDELQPKDVKEAEERAREEKRIERRQRKQAQSMDNTSN